VSLPEQLLSSRYKNENTSTREDLEINDFITNQEFDETLSHQYLSYQDLGRDLLKEYDLEDSGLDLDIIRRFIAYINENVLPISDYAGSHPDYQLKFMFRVIYELLFIDLYVKFNNDEFEIVDDETELKQVLLGHYTEIYNILNESNPDSFAALKYGYIVTLLNNHLDGLIQHIHKIKTL